MIHITKHSQMNKNVLLVNIPRTPLDKQVYMQSFCQAWIDSGGASIEQNKLSKSPIIKNFLKMLAMTRIPCHKKKQAFLICSRGGHLLKASVPYMFKGEIIPMLWDCWPDTWDTLERDLILTKCRLCFITASDVTKEFSKRLAQIKFVHIPEGVDINDYSKGKELQDRGIDVYELGAKHNYFHKKLMEGKLHEQYKLVYHTKTKQKGLAYVYEKWETFTSKIADTKIVISFPRCMRNPMGEGEVETLTMRYWEGMLSRCVIVGHCPQELIDLIGYNPIIEADFVNPCEQIIHVLHNLSAYQTLVNKNYTTACLYAPWHIRMKRIWKEINESLEVEKNCFSIT